MSHPNTEKPWPAWWTRFDQIIAGTDTYEGKLFDINLMILISVSVIVVFLDRLVGVHESYGKLLYIAEWFFTIVFTIEYILRNISVREPAKYIFSFYGIRTPMQAIARSAASLFS